MNVLEGGPVVRPKGAMVTRKWCVRCGMPCGFFSPVSGSDRGFCAHPRIRFFGDGVVPVLRGETCWLTVQGEQLQLEGMTPKEAAAAVSGLFSR